MIITRKYILYQRLLRVIKTGGVLHIVSLTSGLLFIFSGCFALNIDPDSSFKGYQPLCSLFSIYCLILLFFSQMDAKGRFQNYKQVKELLYENGFQPRIIKMFSSSRCQRNALWVAALDLNMDQQLTIHYKKMGYRWFHILPDFFLSRPSLFLTWRFWQNTLFQKPYRMKYFLW